MTDIAGFRGSWFNGTVPVASPEALVGTLSSTALAEFGRSSAMVTAGTDSSESELERFFSMSDCGEKEEESVLMATPLSGLCLGPAEVVWWGLLTTISVELWAWGERRQ